MKERTAFHKAGAQEDGILKNGMKRIVFLLILSVFVLESLTGCRQSPVLQQMIYVDRVEKSDPEEDIDKEDEEERDPATADLVAENADTDQQNNPNIAQENIPDGAGDTEYRPDMTGEGDALLQSVTDGGIAVEVPESTYMVTTVSETTRNPYWKSSISYESDRYTAERKDGIFEGMGTYVWMRGEIRGEWRNGMYTVRDLYMDRR